MLEEYANYERIDSYQSFDSISTYGLSNFIYRDQTFATVYFPFQVKILDLATATTRTSASSDKTITLRPWRYASYARSKTLVSAFHDQILDQYYALVHHICQLSYTQLQQK